MFDQIKDLNAQRQVRGKIQEKVKSNTKTLHKQENYKAGTQGLVLDWC